METLKKFVVIGPESTGKSTLCALLADNYHSAWVPEYAREYLNKNGTAYSYEDLLTIAKGQIAGETSFEKQVAILQPPLLFCDTDLYVMKVWSEFVFNKCHNWILNQIAERKYDGYLLCDVDVPWVKDELREYPDLATRNKLFYFYKDLMVNQSTPWVTISGDFDHRLESARQFIDGVIAKK